MESIETPKTETAIQPPAATPEKPASSGCLGELGWFFSGAVMPLISLSFYRKISGRKVGSTILFFFAFTSVIALLFTIKLGIGMASFRSDIQRAFDHGDIPEITIRDGVTEVAGDKPIILIAENSNEASMFVAVDTTGAITEIDRTQYGQGFLLTKNELHLLNNGRYDTIPLTELHTTFEKNPIIINAKTTKSAWTTFSAIFTFLALVVLFIWHSVFRLMILAVYSLIVWGIVSLFRPNTKFDPIINTALYAVIPAIYLTHLFGRLDISFPFFQTLLFFPIWIIALFAALSNAPFISAEPPSRLWVALVGLPMVVVFIVDVLATLPSPYGAIALWVLTILTIMAGAGLRLFFRFKDRQPAAPALPLQ